MHNGGSSWIATMTISVTIDVAAQVWQATTTYSVGIINCLILGQKSAKTRGKFFKNSTLLQWTRFVLQSLCLPARPALLLLFELILVTKNWIKYDKMQEQEW